MATETRLFEHEGFSFDIFDSTLAHEIVSNLTKTKRIAPDAEKIVTLDTEGFVLLDGKRTRVQVVELHPASSSDSEYASITSTARYIVRIVKRK